MAHAKPSAPKHTNRLAKESSPYLLQHAHNPVDWYPWGPEAFQAARSQNKPIFLSVGYSTCYWCHVMERQSFENESIAQEMNQRFISIKVDREERPDVDQLYMLAVQVLTHHGGWPMSVFLTPDLRPFYGGTYFPPADSHGRPGFPTILRAISDAFHNHPGDVEKSASQLQDILQQISEPPAPDNPITFDAKFIDSLIHRSIADYDPTNGGFGTAPKFPRETLLELLLTYCDPQSVIGDRRSEILPKVLHTLDSLSAGGIRDHLGGGFHRYSTDEKWLVPHFEIMLYDNAMLAWCYVEAYRQTQDLRYAEFAQDILDFVLRELTSPDGAFYTALDAEVDAMEGATYLWTPAEIESILGADDAKLFNHVYGLDRGPNFADPHGPTPTPDKNVLFLANSISGEYKPRLAAMRQKLYEARRTRKQPLLDTKIITSWNALTIRALAFAGQVLREKKYIDAASKAADFILRHHRTPGGGLYRSSRDGEPKHAGFLDDYAFLIQSLLALSQATGQDTWKDHAATVAATMQAKFADQTASNATRGFFFSEEGAPDLIVRQKTGSDSPLPSGNAVAEITMLALGKHTVVRDTLSVFARQLRDQAEGMSSLLQAALLYVREHGPFTVSAAPNAQRPLSPKQIASGVVTIRPAWTGPQQLNVNLNILEPFHIQAHQPAEGQVPTTLTISGDHLPDVESIDYPPGERRRFAFADRPIRVYAGQVTIAVRFKQPVAPSTVVMLALTYQACDDNTCLPTVVKPMEIPAPQ